MGDKRTPSPSEVEAINPLFSETIRPEATVRFDSEAVRRQVAKRLMGSLLVIDGVAADVGRHVVVENTVFIGREPGGLQLFDGRISRRHAKVTRQEDGTHLLTDLGSTNGTALNGEEVSGQQPLRDGDRVHLGQTDIKFTLVDETEASYLRRIEQLARTDQLTGLMAKHRFDSLLQEAIRVSIASESPLSLAMMDLDGLKSINDANGHQMGATTIREVGRLLGRLVQGRGEACRFGGDEYCVFLNSHDIDQALRWAESFRREVGGLTVTIGERSVQPSISIGIAQRPSSVEDEESLVELADQALYRAKGKGRNTVSS
jgi:two-component system cell cycle response regulator